MMLRAVYGLVLILIAVIDVICCGKCPLNSELIRPCVCNQSLFYCRSNESYNMKRVFEYTSRGIPQWYDKKFNRLHISNTELTKLDESAFFDINFEEIYIENADKLRKIHSNAFGSTRMHTKKLVINGAKTLSNMANNYNLFDALSTINNIESIVINGSNITDIPEYAFRPIMGQQWNLKEVTIFGPIQAIGDFAFYDMPYWMRNITIGSLVTYITAHAFDVRSRSHERLTINLSHNMLTTASFELGVFANAKRPLYLDLTHNQIDHLDELIFLPLISRDIMNQVDVAGNPLECSCHILWLLKNKSKYERQVLNAVCNNGRPLWELGVDEVGECNDTDIMIGNS